MRDYILNIFGGFAHRGFRANFETVKIKIYYIKFIIFVIFILITSNYLNSFTLYPAHGRVDRGNLVLIQFLRRYLPPNFRNIRVAIQPVTSRKSGGKSGNTGQPGKLHHRILLASKSAKFGEN